MLLIVALITNSVLVGIFFNSKVYFYGSKQYGLFIFLKWLIILFTLVIVGSIHIASRKVQNIDRKNIRYNILSGICYSLFILVVVDLIVFFVQNPPVNYGPITIINGDQTQIHWYTEDEQTFNLTSTAGTFSYQKYHNVFVNSSNFNFTIPGITILSNYQYKLPPVISKFIVTTDLHSQSKYIKAMNQDYDFHLMAGDYSSGGLAREFAGTFNGIHKKPLILAVGNHDRLGDVDQLIPRPTNYYQKITISDCTLFSFSSQQLLLIATK
ncbi:Calcineurin-like_phosphoesterase domain-containing protein [Hexamita inflata]|uniref:Calcineurin-like phosphoesterase domain-containing protein n=1 Tax=Hexamita inflata TaxID=28002 RepID=A0AA86TXC2_9EUKA|nr:Calcineurin-like phosphoesterase domain-containing protein [Hexamita inflata]